ncbi:MAG: DUF2231 domain-containing protein [Elusimicrobia bacterium]|nr:DUF2231 domain-containing protein [Elusimicrobiota bacterium]
MIELPPLYLLHPIAVHFPIALLTVGWAANALSRRAAWLHRAASWFLWLGTAAAWAAVGLGLLAEETAPHVPLAWKTLKLHETLAFWTAGLFTALSLWRWRLSKWKPALLLIAWLGACGVLLATAYKGGELVFTHGMGVASP